MKPWFEKELFLLKELAEADILKFPDPKAKVIRMPNVQEYTDFITCLLYTSPSTRDVEESPEASYA